MSTDQVNVVTPKVVKTVSALKRTCLQAFHDSPFVVPPSPMMERLGCGNLVTVYRYKRRKVGTGVSASPWAIKKAKRGRARRSIMDRLATEGKILRTLDHPNIVIFKKLTKTPEGDICLSMEDCGEGLDDVICKRQDDEHLFTSQQITKVAWSLAKALDYLHNEKKLLHGDIKSGNVLVKSDFEQVKLCDFGVSISLRDDLSGPLNTNDSYIGSEPWNSREIIDSGLITDKADIFAYGLVIWEMLALDVPHTAIMLLDDAESDLERSFTTHECTVDNQCVNASYTVPQAYYDALGTRPPLPDFDYDESYNYVIGTFICCTCEDYKERPNARDVVESMSLVFSDEEKRPSVKNAPTLSNDHENVNTLMAASAPVSETGFAR